MQAVRFTLVHVAILAALVASQACLRRRLDALIVDWTSDLLLAVKIAMTWLRVLSIFSTTASHCAFLISLSSFMLINHEIDCFLRIIKVEFVVIVLFLLLRLFVFVDVVFWVLLRAPVVQEDICPVCSFRLAQTVLGSTQNFLLKLNLLSELLRSASICPIIVTLEKRIWAKTFAAGRRWLRRHAV